MFHRLAGEAALAARQLKKQRKKGSKRRRSSSRGYKKRAKRGKARAREVDEFWRDVASRDVGDMHASYFDLSPWCSAVVVPNGGGRAWAGVQRSGRPLRTEPAAIYHSRQQRLRALAVAAGVDSCIVERRWGGGGKRRRVEEGGDCSGVT